jgi:ABC-type amino acid transport substrate-binding protein
LNSNKISDLGFAGLSIANDRLQVVDFLNPHLMTSVTFITPFSKPIPNITLVFQPFDYLIWFCVIITFILKSFNEILISRHIFLYKNMIRNRKINFNSFFQLLCRHLPTVHPLRIIVCVWLLAYLILRSSYSGCLYSLMTIPLHVKTIDTITELSIEQKSGRIQVIASRGSIHFQELKVSILSPSKNLHFPETVDINCE